MAATVFGNESADIEARFRLAHQIARERNDRALVERIERAARDPSQLAAIEREVGIDPGGWAMNGQRIFHPTPVMLAKMKPLDEKLDAAMRAGQPEQIRNVLSELRTVMGDQAGVPDARRKGERATPQPITEAEAVKLFLHVLPSKLPTSGQMLRVYAGLVRACCEIRPAVERQQPSVLKRFDKLVADACKIMTNLQQPEGHFPFPDLRGKNIRFGDMTEHLLQSGKGEVRDGWLLTPDPGGGSQFDNGECGNALLLAGKTFQNDAWTKSSLRAADWALAQPCVANFNYNAFSVSLLAAAYCATREPRYLDGALKKFRIGVAPGQVENGRWIDPHNARIVYHLIIVRALNDLHAVAGDEVEPVRAKAVAAVVDEFTAMGVTDKSFALRELSRYATTQTTVKPRLCETISLTAAVVRARANPALTELAALATINAK